MDLETVAVQAVTWAFAGALFNIIILLVSLLTGRRFEWPAVRIAWGAIIALVLGAIYGVLATSLPEDSSWLGVYGLGVGTIGLGLCTLAIGYSSRRG